MSPPGAVGASVPHPENRTPPARAGEPFSPLRKFRGPVVPETILANTALSEGAKLLYSRLLMYAGNKTYCWVGREELKNKLGTSFPKIDRRLRELGDFGLIKRVQGGRGEKGRCDPTLTNIIWNDVLLKSLGQQDGEDALANLPKHNGSDAFATSADAFANAEPLGRTPTNSDGVFVG